MAAKQKTYSIQHVLLLVAVFLPMLLTYVKYSKRVDAEDKDYNKPNLVGLVISNDKPEFTWSNWLDGSYQKNAEDYDNDHWALKESMVRLNNQFYYDAFNQLRVNGFVSGKENYVFAEGYIFSAFGDDLDKREKIVTRLEKARVVKDSLKAHGIDLILGFAPGKGAYCEEFISDKYKHKVNTRNYDIFREEALKKGHNVLDLFAYFETLKPNAKYPLFTRFGHHWSYYGECLAVDTIIGYIEQLRHTDMPDIKWDQIEVVDTARSRDADVLKSMNLYSNPPQNMKLAYPLIQFENDSIKNRTRVLTLGDSYWYGPVYMGVSQQAFGYGDFWYYYNRVVPQRESGVKLEVWELDLKKEIESYQVIMLMYADGNLPGYGNGFIEDVYEMYTHPKEFEARRAQNKQVQSYAKQIRENPALLKKTTKKSNDLQIPLDSAIKLDARRMAGIGNDKF
jgi:hypothetical protein